MLRVKAKHHSVSLSEYTTFHLGGLAEYFVTADSLEAVQTACRQASDAGVPVRVLGGGSNILAADEGVRGFVLQMALLGRSYEIRGGEVLATFGAGEMLDAVVAETVSRGWWGLENLSSIPGTIGATPIQNVGAYGVEIADVFVSLEAVHLETGELKTFTHAECHFGYRDSFFKSEVGRMWCVVSVTLRLSTVPQPKIAYKDLAQRFVDGSPAEPAAVRAVVTEIRAGKFPDWRVVGTAGSFFKNPIVSEAHFVRPAATYKDLPGFPMSDGNVKVPLGWILDTILKIRGVYEGAVGSYEGQALVLVAKQGATAREVTAFAERIAAAVLTATDITIEWEVTRWS